MAVSTFGMILVPFIFTLLVLLLVKAPKAGVALIGAVVVVVAGLFCAKLVSHRGGMGVGVPGVLELGIFAPFIFVLLVLLLVKAPKAGATLIGVIVFMVLAGLVFLIPATRHRRTERTVLYDQSVGRVTQILPEGVRHDEVSGNGLAIVKQVTLPSSRGRSRKPSPIWSEGVEDEYEADVYPSRLAAVRSLGSQLDGWIERVVEDTNQPPEIVLFQEEHERSLLWELERAIETALPAMRCSIEAGLRNIDSDEIGITLQFNNVTTSTSVPWANEPGPHVVSGRVLAKARTGNRETNVSQSFIEKPWVVDFASFASQRPKEQYVVARSWEACTSENEAKELAMQDAATELQRKIGKKWTIPGVEEELTVGPVELEEGRFIVDQFVQSFDGMSGRIWRHAMLIDVSAPKLKWLEGRMGRIARIERLSWAGMILSAVGVLVVIIVAYLFLNMATKGYYVWSLRIAGTVLAVAGVISILLVLR